MCELLAICSKQKTTANEYLKKFFSHGDEHPNGWGFATFNGNNVHVEKEPENAVTSRYLKNRLRAPIVEDVLLAHIRYATIGSLEYENCHPFVRKDSTDRAWTLVHNGTIFRAQQLNPYVHVQEGGTDSERILCHIVAQIDEATKSANRPLVPEERFVVVEKLLTELSEGNKLNIILYDGEYLYVHMNMTDTLHYRTLPEGGLLFSTERLDPGAWRTVPLTALCVYRDGELVYEGESHRRVFIDNPEDMQYLFMDFAGL